MFIMKGHARGLPWPFGVQSWGWDMALDEGQKTDDLRSSNSL